MYPCKHKISNATSLGNVMSRGMSCLVEMPRLVSWKLLFPRKNYALNTRNITCCHAWRNEVIIERYCILRTENTNSL